MRRPLAVVSILLSQLLGAQAAWAQTDEELLDQTEAQAAMYFWDKTFGGDAVAQWFVFDRDDMPQRSSIAATGFGLAALVLMAERYGTSSEWAVTPLEAQTRAQQILQAAVDIQAMQADDPTYLYGKDGLLYRFVNPDGTSDGTIEVSTVDTALFTAGALTAGRYFGGNVEEFADQLLDNMNWTLFYKANPDNQTGSYCQECFYHGWKPICEDGYGVVLPDEPGCWSDQTWDRPSDETLLVSLLALASDPEHEGFLRSLYAWNRETRSYAGYSVVNSFFGSMFTYVFGQVFFDFDRMGEDDPPPDALGDPMQPVNWFDNAHNAVLANRQFVIDQGQLDPVNWATYGSEQWGLSACSKTNGKYEGTYGAEPADFDPFHDGTVPPYSSISSMPLVRDDPEEELSDNLGFQALRHYYDTHFSGLWGPYGPRDSLKTTLENGRPVTAYSQLYLGIDVGPEALMIENYRTGLLHQHFMTHLGIRRAVRKQFPAIAEIVNTPPVLSPIDDSGVQEGHLLTLELEAQDAEDDGLTYGVDPLPEGATMTRSVFRWTPGTDQAGDYSVTFFVSDGEFQTPEDAMITVCEGCPSDLGGDCEVGPFDLAILLGNWGPCPGACTPGDPKQTCAADFNGDCNVGPLDLAMLLGSWGQCT